MRLLDRYLLREFLIPLGFCLCGFLILWDFSDLFGELHSFQDKHLHGTDIAEYYFYKTPEFLILVLPVALLLALLYALTNHARHNEITAIRAAGVSLGRLCLPYLVVGFIASLLLFALDEYAAPKTIDIAEAILTRRIERRPGADDKNKVALDFVNSRIAGEGRIWHADSYDLRTFEMTSPKLIWPSTNGEFWLMADHAVWTNGAWTFFNKVSLKVQTNGQLRPLLQTNLLVVPELSETPAEIRTEIDIEQHRAIQRRTQRADIPLSEIFTYLQLHPVLKKEIRSWVYTKLHGRFAGPWTCFVVVLLGVPFAAASGRRNVFVAVAASIFICFSYFILQQVGFALGGNGIVPAWLGAWLPNLFFGAAGLVLMAKVR